MTILQVAYDAYLKKKYEKEINDFKEQALTMIDNKINRIKDVILCEKQSINNEEKNERIEIYTETLSQLDDLKINALFYTLSIEDDRLWELDVFDLAYKYKDLNDLIVKGEIAQFEKIGLGEYTDDYEEYTVCDKEVPSDGFAEYMKSILEDKYNGDTTIGEESMKIGDFNDSANYLENTIIKLLK